MSDTHLHRNVVTHTETWYVLQYSRKGDDDWYDMSGDTYDTLTWARRKLRQEQMEQGRNFDLRIVKKILTEEVIE